MDKIGFALVVPGKFMDVRLMVKLLALPPSEVVSQIRINFSMVLNLLLSHNPDQIEELLRKSFANFLITRSKQKKGNSDGHKYLWQNFLRHLKFLKSTGFVAAANELTQDGQWASQLRVDQPLLIAEGFRRGVFPQSDPDMLAAVIASFVNEREADERISSRFVPDSLAEAFSKVTGALKPFAARMAQSGFDIRPLQLRPAATVYAWAGGQSWEIALRISEMEEGDLAMLIVRTADNLRHIRGLKDVFPAVARTASISIEKIMRQPVVNEY
jgi:superfamily II RNA helicase